MGALVAFHAWLARRPGLEPDSPESSDPHIPKSPSPQSPILDPQSTADVRSRERLPNPQIPKSPNPPYWPRQAVRDVPACLVVLAVVLALSLQHGVSGPEAGVELAAPANPAEDPGTARPEWSFRGLFQFREVFMHLLPESPESVPIFVISGLTVLVFFAMPWIGRSRAGPPGERGLHGRSAPGTGGPHLAVVRRGRTEHDYLSAVRAGRIEGQRAKELAWASASRPAGPWPCCATTRRPKGRGCSSSIAGPATITATAARSRPTRAPGRPPPPIFTVSPAASGSAASSIRTR